MRGKARDGQGEKKPTLSKAEWTWKLTVIVIAYLLLYYLFGYYVAWKNPELRQYYGGFDPGSFLAQLRSVAEATPWMFPFQAGRALLWVLLVLPMVRFHKGGSLELALVMAFFFAVWSSQLLIPNPFMPMEVARVHFVETSISNFIFGLLVGWLLSRHHSSFKDVFVVR